MSQLEGDQVRQDLLQAIGRMSDRFPDLRICQLISNAIPLGCGKDIYYIEDAELLDWLLAYEAKVMAAAINRPGQQ